MSKKANNKFSSCQMRSSEYKDHNINKDTCLDMEIFFEILLSQSDLILYKYIYIFIKINGILY